MHGILFKQLNEYVTGRWGEDAWRAAMDEAGIEPKLYLPVTEYPDDEAARLVDGVVAVADVDRETLLAGFGEALAPALLDTFKAHVEDDWDALDLLEHAQNQVFTVLHSEGGDAGEVTASREGPDSVAVEYRSSLEMCELTKGVLRGVGQAYDETVDVSERTCMHQGADACRIAVERT